MKIVNYDEFIQEMTNLKAVGPEVEFDENFTTEDWWDEDHQKVLGFIRYYDDGQVVCKLTGEVV